MPTKLSYNYIYNYFKENNCELLETNYINAKTNMRYRCECGNESFINWSNFKEGKRCKICYFKKLSKLKTYNQSDVNNYYNLYGYELKSIYNGGKKKDNVICPNGHSILISFNNFKNLNQRCSICYRENNFGENHPRYNPNREEIPLNQRLRVKTHNKKWITDHMKNDPCYHDFLNNPENYVVDHIIPIKLFCILTEQYKLNENQIRTCINKKENLQLLTIKENNQKGSKGSIKSAKNFLIEHGISL